MTSIEGALLAADSWFPCTDLRAGTVLVAAPLRNAVAARLADRGHKVRYVATRRALLDRFDDEDPDLVIIDAALEGEGALALCLTLRGAIADDRPIVVTGGWALEEERRLAFLRAGAWDYVPEVDGGPDAATLLRLEALIAARRGAARLRQTTMTDPGTGLYNRLGLSRWARELGAQAKRTRDPLACVVFRIEFIGESEAAMHACSRVCHDAGRESDVIARFGAFQIAVLAPNTDTRGIIILAERLAAAMCADRRGAGTAPDIAITASYNAVDTREDPPISPVDLVAHTASALRTVPVAAGGPWLFSTDLPRWRTATN